MKWHIAHRHEIPNAFDALGKDYETKATNLLEENALLKKKMKELEMTLEQTKIDLMQARAEELKQRVEIAKLNDDFHIALMAIAVMRKVIKEQLNLEMPNPFEQ
jgi:hypothetical protein